MSLIEEIVNNVVSYTDYRYNSKRDVLHKKLKGKGLKVYFAHELNLCKRKAELKQLYPELELELMRKPLHKDITARKDDWELSS